MNNAAYSIERKMYSPTWNYFKRLSPGLAKCDLCKKKLSFKTSITNLKRHLLLKHKVNLGFKVSKVFTLDQQANVRKLIKLVKQHPCLWDNNSVHFNNSEKKIKAWKTIASTLCPEVYPVLGVGKLSERFSNLKEHFLAERIRILNGKKVRPSTYYKDLQFLESAQEVINISSASSLQGDVETGPMDIFEINEVNVKQEPIDETYNGNVFETIPQPTQEEDSLQDLHEAAGEDHDDSEAPESRWTNGNMHIAANGRRKEIKSEEGTIKEDKNKLPQYSLHLNSADRDVLFLLSLTEEMRRVPKEMKTNFKSELMMTISRLVQKYRRANRDG